MKSPLQINVTNSLRIAGLVVFATAALITLTAHHNQQSQDSSANTAAVPDRQRKSTEHSSESRESSDRPSYNQRSNNFTVDSTVVTQAAEAVRLSINSHRRKHCPDVTAFAQLTRVNHAKGSESSSGTEVYRLELTFDGAAAVFAVVRRDSNTTAKLNDDEKTFVVKSSVPAPCDRHASDQLAISFAGVTSKMHFFAIAIDP